MSGPNTHRRSWRRVCAGAALLLLFLAAGCVRESPTVSHESSLAWDGSELKIVSYNVLHGGPDGTAAAEETLEDRLRVLYEHLGAIKADVVILQEVSDSGYRHRNVLLRLQDMLNDVDDGELVYNAVYARSGSEPAGLTGFEQGIGILTRFEILDYDVWTFRDQAAAQTSEPRQALRVTLRGKDRNLDVVGLQVDGESAAANAAELVEELLPRRGNDHPLVIGGDWGSDPGSDAMSRLRAAGLVDVWAALRPNRPGYTTHHDRLDDRTARATRRTDYVHVSPELTIVHVAPFLDYAVDLDPGPEYRWLWTSDHSGVFLKLRPASAPER